MTGENHMAFRDRRPTRHSELSSSDATLAANLAPPTSIPQTAAVLRDPFGRTLQLEPRCPQKNRRPTTGRASAVRSPRFSNAKVRVAVAWMHGSAGHPVVVSRPLGVSREKVGTSVPLAR